MRPLCGAIIAAGALIGLGLFSTGYGQRYGGYTQRTTDGTYDSTYWVKISQMDTALLFLLFLLAASLMIGLAVAFVGLAYHHHKRHHEFLLRKDQLHAKDPI